MAWFGRVFHFAADAALISTALAGIRHSSGITLNPSNVSSPEIRNYIERYLDVGEWVLAQSVFFMSRSTYFKRGK